MFVYEDQVYNEKAAEQVLAYLFPLITPQSVIDLGCGLGTWLKVAKDLGVSNILGIDQDHVPLNRLHIPIHSFIAHDLCQPLDLNKKFDLAICLEVAEHLPPKCAKRLVESLITHSETILFSAALLHQEGQFHVNEQPYEYWVDLFNQHGYSFYDGLRQHFWDNQQVDWWYRQNLFLVSKKDLETSLGFKIFRNTYIHPELFMNKVEEVKGLKEVVRLNGIKYQALEQKLKQHQEDLQTQLKAIFKIIFPRFSVFLKRQFRKKG